jgi:predicted phage-related endonuclease
MSNFKYLEDLGLTLDQLEAKKNYIGGSSAKDIADGEWLKVYKALVEGESEDLKNIFKVQLGHVSEKFNLLWFARENGYVIEELQTQEAVYSADYPFIGCLPDAIMMCEGDSAVIDAKHTGAHAPWWNEQKVAEYYFPQMHHNMIATQCHKAYLSVIFGNEGPVKIPIEYNKKWADKYIDLCTAFWVHVEAKDPPEDTKKITTPKIKLDDMRELDMTKGNQATEWSTAAYDFQAHQGNAKTFEDAKKALKEMVPEDVKHAHGNNVEITRNKKGAMAITVVIK